MNDYVTNTGSEHSATASLTATATIVASPTVLGGTWRPDLFTSPQGDYVPMPPSGMDTNITVPSGNLRLTSDIRRHTRAPWWRRAWIYVKRISRWVVWLLDLQARMAAWGFGLTFWWTGATAVMVAYWSDIVAWVRRLF